MVALFKGATTLPDNDLQIRSRPTLVPEHYASASQQNEKLVF
jgi:hypothetical protein